MDWSCKNLRPWYGNYVKLSRKYNSPGILVSQ